MKIEKDCRYAETHEWVRVEGDLATAGITDYAQSQLSDVVYVELPEVGKTVSAGGEAAVLESTKAAADVYSPVSGTIVEVNSALTDSPEKVNQDPESGGWLFRVELGAPAELERLMDEPGYKAMVG